MPPIWKRNDETQTWIRWRLVGRLLNKEVGGMNGGRVLAAGLLAAVWLAGHWISFCRLPPSSLDCQTPLKGCLPERWPWLRPSSSVPLTCSLSFTSVYLSSAFFLCFLKPLSSFTLPSITLGFNHSLSGGFVCHTGFLKIHFSLLLEFWTGAEAKCDTQ